MGLLIEAQTLAQESDVLIFDCRASLLDKTEGQRAYLAGHIPGAQYADLEKDLSSPAGDGGRHPLPEKDELVSRLQQWGVNQQSSIVCYDANNGAYAARMWWLLRWLGHEDVRVLNGGLDAWTAAGHALSIELVTPATGNFVAGRPLTRIRLAPSLPDPSITLIDARDAARFRGEVEPIDPVAGHIPGAVCATFTDNLQEGRFGTPETLAARFQSLDIKMDADTVCYCGSGVTATHNILAMMLAGYPEPALYPGSWSEWIVDPSRPVATG